MDQDKSDRLHRLAAQLRDYAGQSRWDDYRAKMLQAAALLDRQAGSGNAANSAG